MDRNFTGARLVKKESRHARRHRGCQKERGPTIEPFRRDQPEHDYKARKNCYQAYCDMYLRECFHAVSFF
jgi:hypothetical protein